jgi:hypothetical protein
VNSSEVLNVLVIVLITFSLVGCTTEQDCLTVSEVWQNADSLDGKRICVVGQAHLRFIPYHPLQVGGCSPDQDIVESSHIVGMLDLYDGEPFSSTQRVTVATSDLQCEGDICSLVCWPFAPTCEGTFCSPDGYVDIEAFEFVGTLRVDGQPGSEELLLEDLDLDSSRRLADGEWGPIPTGDYIYMFP